MNEKTDNLYLSAFEKVSDFRFDSGVVEVFEDMIERSVPGYAAILGMTGELAEQFAQANTSIYDLGCSLGGSSLSIAQRSLPENMTIVALDSSEPMVKGLKTKLAALQSAEAITPFRDKNLSIEVRQEDICTTQFKPASFAVMNFTLQFIQPQLRSGLIERIYDSLVPGGALLLSEKIEFEDKKVDELIVQLHHKFKKSMGYSDLEIAQKRASIEKVLLPETADMHCQRLAAAGFTEVTPWFQCFNFCSFLAIKPK